MFYNTVTIKLLLKNLNDTSQFNKAFKSRIMSKIDEVRSAMVAAMKAKDKDTKD